MIRDYIQKSLAVKTKLLEDGAFLKSAEDAVSAIKTVLQSGNKILVAGNGGSAADSQHFVAELVGRYKKERKAYPAIALTTDTSILTAVANDYGFEKVFSRQIEALGKPNDLFIGISTSGNSENVLHALQTAQSLGLKTLTLLGRDGGKAKVLSDVSIVVPSDITSHIQEVHGILIHAFSEALEL